MKRSGSPAATVAVLAAAGLLAALLQPLVIPLVPRLPALLDAAPTDASWVVTITLLTGAIVTPVSGRLGDLFGKRRVLLLTLAATTTGTVISALAGSLSLTRGPKRLGEVRVGARRGRGAGSGRPSPRA
ncbi:MFS transporter [Streptomyces sp. NPDC059881]|uniref:MFS transporter n=1 Tax=Streptomyces sp. NPDC059881 TaxID=3346986 RepID=UPI00365D01BC